MNSGKWIIRITLTLAVLSAFFWCTWTLFAPIPNSPAIPLLYGYEIPTLSRSVDFMGFILVGLIAWSSDRQRQKFTGAAIGGIHILFQIFLGVFTFIAVVGLPQLEIGVVPTSIISVDVYLILRFSIWYSPLLAATLADTKKASISFCRDFAAALRRSPATQR